MAQISDPVAGVDRNRLKSIAAREAARFVASRPKTRAALGRAQKPISIGFRCIG